MKSFRDRNPFVIGATCVAVIFVLVAGAFAAGYLHVFEKNFPISAQFVDAAGLRSGAEVRVAGVKVGRVTSVVADREHGRVNVRMVVNDGVELGPQTRAEAALATLLGKRYVRLSGPVVRPYLTSEAVIPVERTTTPFDVFELTKVATRSIEATDTDKLNRLIEQLAAVTEGKQQTVTDLVQGLARVLDRDRRTRRATSVAARSGRHRVTHACGEGPDPRATARRERRRPRAAGEPANRRFRRAAVSGERTYPGVGSRVYAQERPRPHPRHASPDTRHRGATAG